MKTSLWLAFAVCAVTALADPYRLDRCVAGPNAPASMRIAPPAEKGTRLIVSGAVLDDQGRPLSGAYVRAFHADASGRYSNETRAPVAPRLCGVVRTDSSGRYSFETIHPGSYPDSREPAHIHFMVFGIGVGEQRMLLQFEGDPFLNGRKSGGRTSTIRPVVRRASAEHCERDLRLQ